MTWNCCNATILRFCSTVLTYQAKDSFLQTLMAPSRPKKLIGSLVCWEESQRQIIRTNDTSILWLFTSLTPWFYLSSELFKFTRRVELIKSLLNVSLFDGLFGRDNGLGLGVKFKIIWFEKRSHHCYYYLSRRSMCVRCFLTSIFLPEKGDRGDSKRKHFRGIFRSRAGSHILKDMFNLLTCYLFI